MMRSALVLLTVFGLFGCAAGTPESAEPFAPIASVRQVMDALTVPFSDAVWAAASEPPGDEEGWLAVEHAAIALAESGNLLMMAGRAPANDQTWTARALLMVDAARRAADAAAARDADDLMTAGDELYESCVACHQLYMPTPDD